MMGKRVMTTQQAGWRIGGLENRPMTGATQASPGQLMSESRDRVEHLGHWRSGAQTAAGNIGTAVLGWIRQ